jgi:hypothetical protein
MARVLRRVRADIGRLIPTNKEQPPHHAPFDFGLLPGDPDEHIITSAAFKGQRGFFTRDESGAAVGVDLAGRLFSRVHPLRVSASEPRSTVGETRRNRWISGRDRISVGNRGECARELTNRRVS